TTAIVGGDELVRGSRGGDDRSRRVALRRSKRILSTARPWATVTRQPRLHHLHLRLDGTAERRNEHASRDREPAAVDAGHLPARGERLRVAEDAVQLRRVGVGVLLAV